MKTLVFSTFFLSTLASDASNNNQESLCDRQTEYFEENLEANVLWARKMRNSWGNIPPPGFFSGNLYDFGNYDQCVNFRYQFSEVGDIQGQYCLLMIPYSVDNVKSAKFMAPSMSPETTIGVGACLPKSCSPEQIQAIANKNLKENFNLSLSSGYSLTSMCSTGGKTIEFNALQIFAICLFTIVIILATVSTIYDISCDIKGLEKRDILCSFSIIRNSCIIMSLKPGFLKEILSLHGLRALSIIWIVLSHSFMQGYWMTPTINGAEIVQRIRELPILFFITGTMAVDTFFLLSAFLMTTSAMRELDKTKKLNVPFMLAKRYFRIAVPLAVGILFALTFFHHLSDGPLWNFILERVVVRNCNDWWWSSLVFASNFVNPGKLCFGHDWYLMVDMQLYFLSPIVLYPLWRLRNRVKTVIAMIFLIASSSVIYVFVTDVQYDLRVSYMSDTKGVRDFKIYYMTLARVDSWMMGILLGYIFHKVQGKTVILSKLKVFLGWFSSFLMLLTVTLAQYPLQRENFKENSIIADAFYDSFKRIAWCVSIGWIIFACHFSYGGVINKFLSLPIWLPISKLSFCIYLVHVPIQLIFLASTKVPRYASYIRGVSNFFGDFGITFCVAFVAALLFEYPVLNFLYVLSKKFRK